MADQTFVQCNACGGIYRPVQTDGSLYFHACPDRKIVGTQAAPTKDNPLATAAIFGPIVNRRDENVHVDPDTRKVSMKSEGAGITPVTDPSVIAALTAPQGA